MKSPITSTIIYILFSPVTIAIAFGFFLKNLSISLDEHLIPFSRNSTYFLRSSLNWFAFEEVMLTVGLLLNFAWSSLFPGISFFTRFKLDILAWNSLQRGKRPFVSMLQVRMSD